MNWKSITVLLLLLSTLTFGQTFRISKILGTNLFELNNSQKVKLYGLYIPAADDTNKSMSELAAAISKWEDIALLDNEFEFKFLEVSEDSIAAAIAYVRYPMTKYNLAGHLLSKGYAAIEKNVDSTFYSEVSLEQESAQYHKYGMWKDDLKSKDFLVVPSSGTFDENNNKYIIPIAVIIVYLFHAVLTFD